jgi:hypothetical protein
MVEDLVRRARRRLVVNETLAQTAFAAAVAIGGVALILILGTRYLEWWTLALFAAVGVGVGAYRVWRAVPGTYATAIRIDEAAQLHDSLSTALYFDAHPAKAGELRDRQRHEAEQAAATVDLSTAIPFTLPRSFYAMSGAGALALALFFLRYNVGHGLDLSAPITEVLFEDQAAAKPKTAQRGGADAARQAKMEAAESLLAKLGIPLNPDAKPDAAIEKAIEQALDGGNNMGDKGDKGEKGGDGKGGNGLEQPQTGDPMDGKKSDDGKEGEGKPSGQEGQAGDKGSAKNSTGENNSSLLSKLKEAMSNMMSKSGGDKQQGNQKGQSQQQASKSGEKGDKGQGKGQDQQGQQQADAAQEGDPNGQAQEGQQAEGKAGAKSSQDSAQAGSGVGSQDGAKELRAAEQLKAMGKISEIIGKRAATVTGETTIEVQSGNQQLRTDYSKKAVAHGEADGDVSRDEIPVSLQPYVKQYFEQVRKAAPATPAKSAEAKAPKP